MKVFFCQILFLYLWYILVDIADMRLIQKKSGRFTYLYVIKSYRTEDGKSTSKVVEKFGTVEELREKLGGQDPIRWAEEKVAGMNAMEKADNEEVVLKFKPGVLIEKGGQRSYNGGYLFLQKIYYELGLDYICKKIEKRHRNRFDLNGILSRLLYTRLLYPGSKLSSLEESRRFFEQPQEDIHQVYRALSILAAEFNEIQADVYKRSLKLGQRDTGVVYYDLTNYYFEWEEEGGIVQYGHSKEGRPLPVVQMGLFVDKEGFPLAMNIEPGNTAETVTLKPMEEMLKEKFGLSRIIVCTDAGLSSYENRKNDAVSERSFITVQSVKKMNRRLQEWTLGASGWHVHGADDVFDLTEVDAVEYYNTLFYKDRWEQVKMSTGEILEMRYHEQFSVDITCDPGMESRKIIPYTLQLLIENVTKHNVISTRHPMKVTIRAGAEGVTVTNPVRIRKSDTSTGIGLKYIASHYKLYNKDFEYGSDGRCFTAKVPYL